MNCSIPGFPVLHYLPEFAQTHVHWFSESVQPSHPPSPPLLMPSIFLSIRIFSSESADHIRWPKCWSFSLTRVLPMNIQDWFPLGLAGLLSLQSKRLSRVFSSTTAWKLNSSLVNEAEVDVLLEFPCFFYDLTDVSNLISGSSAFSKYIIHLEVLGSCTAEA